MVMSLKNQVIWLKRCFLRLCWKVFKLSVFFNVSGIWFDKEGPIKDQNCLLKASQSGFRPGDSCIHQLIAITHNIFTAFDANPSLEVCGIFLDLSKAFDRVWHKGLIHKLKNIGIDGNLLSLIEYFLHKRYQKVVLNGQSSKWQNVNAGVPQGSVLGPLFFPKLY